MVGVWNSGRIVKKGAGIHYENEGNEDSFLFQNLKGEEDEEDEEDATYSLQSPSKLIASPRNRGQAALSGRPTATIDRLAHSLQRKVEPSTLVDNMYPGAIVLPPTCAETHHVRPSTAKPATEFLRDFRVRPASSLPILHQILAATFDTPCVWVDRRV